MIISGKKVNPHSLEFEGVDFRDYPDFCDSYISYAEFTDFTVLNDDELDLLLELYPTDCHEILFTKLF